MQAKFKKILQSFDDFIAKMDAIRQKNGHRSDGRAGPAGERRNVQKEYSVPARTGPRIPRRLGGEYGTDGGSMKKHRKRILIALPILLLCLILPGLYNKLKVVRYDLPAEGAEALLDRLRDALESVR